MKKGCLRFLTAQILRESRGKQKKIVISVDDVGT
jgi:hypothetical protein